MRKQFKVISTVCLLAASLAVAAGSAIAAPPERYLHVRVEDPAKGENVNVNVPLSSLVKPPSGLLPSVASCCNGSQMVMALPPSSIVRPLL